MTKPRDVAGGGVFTLSLCLLRRGKMLPNLVSAACWQPPTKFGRCLEKTGAVAPQMSYLVFILLNDIERTCLEVVH